MDRITVRQIDLPDYLKNSKFLNNLSIRQLLQHWAVVCAGSVIILSLAALITNDIISRKQELLNNKLIPSANILRNLDTILDEFETRKKQLLAAGDLQDLQNSQIRIFNEQEISAYLLQLAALHADTKDTGMLVQGLEEKFASFIGYDARLVKCLSDNIVLQSRKPANLCEPKKLANYITLLNDSNVELRASLKRLSYLVAGKIKTSSEISHDLSVINLAIVVTVSLIVIAVITAGVSIILFRIDDPLQKFRLAMHDLSSGDMTRRMEESNPIKDEFLELTLDFNRAAERLQSLFDEVISAKNSLEKSEKTTRAILENALVGIAHVNDGRILAVNRKFEEIFGYAKDQIAGMKHEMLYPSADACR
jgi:methyl-accepting chemotaxis protein